jgi:hypothetical protein
MEAAKKSQGIQPISTPPSNIAADIAYIKNRIDLILFGKRAIEPPGKITKTFVETFIKAVLSDLSPYRQGERSKTLARTLEALKEWKSLNEDEQKAVKNVMGHITTTLAKGAKPTVLEKELLVGREDYLREVARRKFGERRFERGRFPIDDWRASISPRGRPTLIQRGIASDKTRGEKVITDLPKAIKDIRLLERAFKAGVPQLTTFLDKWRKRQAKPGKRPFELHPEVLEWFDNLITARETATAETLNDIWKANTPKLQSAIFGITEKRASELEAEFKLDNAALAKEFDVTVKAEVDVVKKVLKEGLPLDEETLKTIQNGTSEEMEKLLEEIRDAFPEERTDDVSGSSAGA